MSWDGGSIPDRLKASYRLSGEPGLELGAMGTALAHLVGAPVRGDTSPQRLTMGPV